MLKITKQINKNTEVIDTVYLCKKVINFKIDTDGKEQDYIVNIRFKEYITDKRYLTAIFLNQNKEVNINDIEGFYKEFDTELFNNLCKFLSTDTWDNVSIISEEILKGIKKVIKKENIIVD